MKVWASSAAWMQLSFRSPMSTGNKVTCSLLIVASITPSGAFWPCGGLIATKTVAMRVSVRSGLSQGVALGYSPSPLRGFHLDNSPEGAKANSPGQRPGAPSFARLCLGGAGELRGGHLLHGAIGHEDQPAGGRRLALV